jgi:tRNA G46 methylase TrmB
MCDYEEESDVLMQFNDLIDVVDDVDSIEKEKDGKPATVEDEPGYNSRKPRWWKNICGKATKSQKRSMDEIFKTHRLPNTLYGNFFNWEDIFPRGSDIWLELGFGRGENLLALAHRKRDEKIVIIGAEIHKPGVGTACQRMQHGIQNNSYWTEYVTYTPALDPSKEVSEETTTPDEGDSKPCDPELTETYRQPYKNLSIYPGDGVKLLPYIPTASLAAVLVTFPDPFPGEKQKQWRVIQTQTVLEIHRILRKSSSGLFFLATDHEGYNEWSHMVMETVNAKNKYFECRAPCPDRAEWMPAISRYEQKGWDEGRRTNLSCWLALPVSDD